MTVTEANKLEVVKRLIDGRLLIREAAAFLDLSERQVKRLKKGVLEHGPEFLAHGNRGRKPANAIPQEIRELIVEMAIGPYRDTSCQHMSELLQKHNGVNVSAKSIARVLKASSIKLRYAKKQRKRRRVRTRLPREGQMLQLDASPFCWLGEGKGTQNLHGAIDDATGKLVGLYLRPTEDLHGYLQVLKQVLANYGIPGKLYTDRHTIFFSPKKDKLSLEEELDGKSVNLTQFGEVLSELGIAQVAARSPQAKGRIERLWNTLQSRLVAELRIANITTMDAANEFLVGFMKEYNSQFGVKPAESTSAYRPSPTKDTIHRVLSLRATRQTSGDSTISLNSKQLKLCRPDGEQFLLRKGTKVTILTHLDGSISALHKGELYGLQPVLPSPKLTEASKKTAKKATPRKPVIQSPSHPWKQPWAKPARHKTTVERYFEARPWLNTELADLAENLGHDR